jgi:hypothetical protein
MNSWNRFASVYLIVEVNLYQRVPKALDAQRAFERYLNVTGEERLP